MMQFTTPTGKYHVTSHGNGWAYEITDQHTGDSLWFQDESASLLQDRTNNFEDEAELDAYFAMICD